MAGDAAYEEVVAAGVDGDGIVARCVSGDGDGGVACLVFSMRHSHHIVKLRVVLKNCNT